tara:strand:- start:433 stop:573 length:141 start_codon:yes stop_codon:yes gene_type:complete
LLKNIDELMIFIVYIKLTVEYIGESHSQNRGRAAARLIIYGDNIRL